MIKEIDAFLTKFGLGYDGGPRSLPSNTRRERIRHMIEEIREYDKATTVEDELDALVDIVYLAVGTACMQGLDFDEAFKRVHHANMRKVRPEGNNWDGDLKSGIVKPEGWKPPNLLDLCE